MRICCVQLPMPVFDREINYARAELAVRAACEGEQRPDLLLLPELWNVGYYPKEGLRTEADENGERTKALMGGLAREYGVNIAAGSIACLRAGRVYNTARAFDRTGALVHSYDKVHRFAPMHEDQFFEAGGSIETFMLDGVCCGFVVCYDLRFPELARKLYLNGAELLLGPVQWPMDRVRTINLNTLAGARAIENEVYFLCANGTGRCFGRNYGGGSFVVSYEGERIAELGSEPGLLFAELDLDALRAQRKISGLYGMRHPEAYV